jgi:transposase-like protein
MVIPESCPACGSTRYKKNGHTRHGKQNHLCKHCERQFSAGAANRLIAGERRAEIAKLLGVGARIPPWCLTPVEPLVMICHDQP